MSRFQEYCRMLGVSPQASKEEVKSAFRAKIKLHHPDKADPSQAEEARRLIEAYHAVLAGEGREEFENPRPQTRPQPQEHWVNQAGREAARRMFERVFREKFAQVFGFRPDLGFDFDAHFGPDPGEFHRPRPETPGRSPNARPTGPAGARPDPHREAGPGPRPDPNRASGPSSGNERSEAFRPREKTQVSPGLRRAEDALCSVVTRFQNRGERSKREWCRDYLANLAQVQILFRDLAAREPRSEAAARLRLGQIKDLMSVIRTMASG